MTVLSELPELHAALLQGAVTAGTAAFCWLLYVRYRRGYVLWWSVAWTLYVLRIGAIVAFLATEQQPWLFVHQIFTGFTALALLWAAFAFSQSVTWERWYALAIAFPLIWSYVAIYHLQSFLLAAVPAVLFLSFATLWTGRVFFTQWRRSGSRGAAVLAAVLCAWGLHHLDYPILRAKGAWNPWGYYLDILFVLAMGIGMVILVLEELDRRTNELTRLSSRMVRQQEDERRRVSLELHDQTAQVWAAVKMQLGLAREAAPPPVAARLDRALDLVDAGIRSIRSVTTHLRPPLLDDLGLVPALRALVHGFAEETHLAITFDAAEPLPAVSDDAALALFRALQEALSNVARHSAATEVIVRLAVTKGELTLVVRDNGHGFKHLTAHTPYLPPTQTPTPQTGRSTYDPRPSNPTGLSGMRERISALRGSVDVHNDSGALVTVRVPLDSPTPPHGR